MSLIHLSDLNLIVLSNKSGIRHVSSASDVTPHTGFSLVPNPIRIQTLFKLKSNSMYTTILPPLLDASTTAATASNMTSSILGKRNRDINSDTTYFYHHYTSPTNNTTPINTTTTNTTTPNNSTNRNSNSTTTVAAAPSLNWKKFLKKYQTETSFSITDRNPNNNKNRVSSTITISQRIRDYVLDPSIPIVTTVLHNTH